MHHSTTNWRTRAGAVFTAAAVSLGIAASASAAPSGDAFYTYSGSQPLSALDNGTVLKTREIDYAPLLGITLPHIKATQLLYKTTLLTGKPDVNVTTVLQPRDQPKSQQRVVGYGSFYDSLNPYDQPSWVLAHGGGTIGQTISQIEAIMMLDWVGNGYTMVITDTEGQDAYFAAGPVYGTNTLDGLRAAFAAPSLGIAPTTKAGLVGYSGGAIATAWAAELAPTYAPDVNKRLVGATMGGVLANPAHNLKYVEGSFMWSGVMPMAVLGISRAAGEDITPYLNSYGRSLYDTKQRVSIIDVLLQYPFLKWVDLTKPEYAKPEDVPIYPRMVNKLILSSRGTPTIPLYVAEGTKGEDEGTPGDKPGIGPGDGVMVAGDVRSAMRKYCSAGTKVDYHEYWLGHIGTAGQWLPTAQPWMNDRFAGKPAGDNCADIKPGNDISPIPDPYSVDNDPGPVVPLPGVSAPEQQAASSAAPAAQTQATSKAPARAKKKAKTKAKKKAKAKKRSKASKRNKR